MPERDDLRALREQRRRERTVRKCGAPSWDSVCETRAIAMYAAAVEATGSINRAATASENDRKTIRDRLSGARGIYLKDALKLGRAGLDELAAQIDAFAAELPPESGVASG